MSRMHEHRSPVREICLEVVVVDRDPGARRMLVQTAFGAVVVAVESPARHLRASRDVVSVRAGGERARGRAARWNGWEVGGVVDLERGGRIRDLEPVSPSRATYRRYGLAWMPLQGLAPRMEFVLRRAHWLGVEELGAERPELLVRQRQQHARVLAARRRGRGEQALLHAEAWEALSCDPLLRAERDAERLFLELLTGWVGSGAELVESVYNAFGVDRD